MNKRIIVVLTILISNYANGNDTLLTYFNGNETFYNFAQNSAGEIFIGSSHGLYSTSNSDLVKIDNEPGYVQFINNEISRSNFSNLETHQKFKSLLPPAYWDYPQQSIRDKNFIYILCKSSLFIYKISTYSTQMEGVSVRCFTANSIGTYSGVYCFGKKLEIPSYCSGNILEKDSTFYICYDGLAIYSPRKGLQFYKRSTTGETQIAEKPLGFARDIYQFKDSSFVLASTEGLFLINKTFNEVEQIFESADKLEPIIIDVTEDQQNPVISFTANNSFYRYGVTDKELLKLSDFGEPIQDGYRIEDEIATKYVLITGSSLILYDYSKDHKDDVFNLVQAHSVVSMGTDTAILTTQNGAFIALLQSREIIPFMKGVEFNKRAIWRQDNILKLGGTTGYFTYKEDGIDTIISESLQSYNDWQRKNISTYFWWTSGIVTLLFLGYFVRNKRKKETDEDVDVSLSIVEDYIKSNLTTVTIESIRAQFGLSNKSLYALTTPEKPGRLITKYRMKMVKDLIAKGQDIEAISRATGFSVSYLKKLKP